MKKAFHAVMGILALGAITLAAQADEQPWVRYEGKEGPGLGKNIVLISGDEEYRSEESLPQLGKILSQRHGFICTVVFAINPRGGGYIDPTYQKNIPGLEALDDADLMIIATRFRDLPDDQMAAIDRYLKAGKPVVGIRTATHAFKIEPGNTWSHYSDGYNGDNKAWEDGFGRLVLGEKWISHHGEHKHESTLGLIAEGASDHVITRGLDNTNVWGPTDVYGVRLPLPGDSQPIMLGSVTRRAGDFDEKDELFGMRPTDIEPVPEKNGPMMPVAWTKSYQLPDGETGKVFTSTIGSSTDCLSEGVRRLLLQGAFWAMGMEDAIPADGLNVDLVGEYKPTKFEFRGPKDWRERNLQPAEHAL